MASMNWGGRRAVVTVTLGLASLALALAVLAGLGTASAAAASRSPVARAASSPPVAQATEVGVTSTSQTLSLALPLRSDTAGLAAFAQAVSTPGSPEYGDYESVPELVHRFGAPAGERMRVVAFLRRAGARDVQVDPSGLFADATVSAGLAHRLFGADLDDFRTATAARFTAPVNAARIPAGLDGAVTGVVGLDTQSLVSGQPPQGIVHASARTAFSGGAESTDEFPSSGYASRSGTPSGCAAALAQPGFTPNQYLNAYGYGSLFSAGITGAGERVALIEINGFKSSDISTYASCFGQRMPPVHAYRVGIKHLLSPGGEATLDLEILASAAPGLAGIDVYEASARATQVLRAITKPLTTSHKPDVISVSLGDCERDTRDAIGTHGINAIQASLELAAASGTSVLASSGDDGSSACVDDRGVPLFQQAVNYPASSTWVTGVGGTQFYLNAANQVVPPPGQTSGQIVWNDLDGAAGGGYSLLFKRPSWQNGVSTAARRIVPDVSMLADPSPGYDIYCSARGNECLGRQVHNPWISFGGTSAATPLLAGGLALVDQYLRQTGHQNLGLANPVLYAIDHSAAGPTVFYDVSQYSNDLFDLLTNGEHALGCCTAGAGFDPASGLGSVDVDTLASVAATIVKPMVQVGVTLPRQRHAVRARRLLATVSCSGRCFVGAVAKLSVGSTLYSASRELRRGGRRTLTVRLGSRTLSRVRKALHHHQRVYATIYAALLDPSGSIDRLSAPQTLRLRD